MHALGACIEREFPARIDVQQIHLSKNAAEAAMNSGFILHEFPSRGNKRHDTTRARPIRGEERVANWREMHGGGDACAFRFSEAVIAFGWGRRLNACLVLDRADRKGKR